MTPLLSILILTVPQRKKLLARLIDRLWPQLTPEVFVLAPDDGPGTIGEKRQRMLGRADAPYVCFIDDDDLVAETYCAQIVKALRRKPDVVGFRLRQYTDGALTGLTIHSLKERAWRTVLHEDGLHRHYRSPNHLNPVRRDLALQVGFPSKNSGEDADFSRGLLPLLTTEEFIDDYVYDYLFRTKQPEPLTMYDDEQHLTRAGMEHVIRGGGSVIQDGRICTTIEQLA